MKREKVAIITGAGRGIGAATAKLFAAMGYKVCVNYHSNRRAAESVAAEIELTGNQCLIVKANVAEEDDVLRLFETVDKELGAISVLINNAAKINRQSRLENMTPQRINELFKNNVTSYFMCCQQAIKRMAVSYGGNGGSIVNVSSGAALTGSPNEYIDYAASKGAIDTLTKGLAKEIAHEGIRVNGVRPGLIDTQMHADGGEADRVNRLSANIPLGRGGTVDEVAEAIYWLASNKSSFTTGNFIDVCGGW